MVCVYRYSELDDAIAQANSLPVAFQASIFAQDIDIALRAANRLDASAVMINDPTAFRTDWMPFAGRRVVRLRHRRHPLHHARHDAGEDDPDGAAIGSPTALILHGSYGAVHAARVHLRWTDALVILDKRAAAQLRDPSEGSGALRWIPELRFAASRMTPWFRAKHSRLQGFRRRVRPSLLRSRAAAPERPNAAS